MFTIGKPELFTADNPAFCSRSPCVFTVDKHTLLQSSTYVFIVGNPAFLQSVSLCFHGRQTCAITVCNHPIFCNWLPRDFIAGKPIFLQFAPSFS